MHDPPSDNPVADWKRTYEQNVSGKVVNSIGAIACFLGLLASLERIGNNGLISYATLGFVLTFLCGAMFVCWMIRADLTLTLTQDSITLAEGAKERTLHLNDILGYYTKRYRYWLLYDPFVTFHIVPLDRTQPDLEIYDAFNTDGDLEHWLSFVPKLEGLPLALSGADMDQTNRD